MYYPIEDIEGFSERLRARLMRAGVRSTRHLLDRGASAADRTKLASATGSSEAEILEAVQTADLMRVKGAGAGYAALLQVAGVKSAPALARAEARTLHAAMTTARALAPHVRRLPTLRQVSAWIDYAGELQPTFT